jgi:hypothetical protein
MYLEVQLPSLTPRGAGARSGLGALGLARGAMPPRLSDKTKEVGGGGLSAGPSAWPRGVGDCGSGAGLHSHRFPPNQPPTANRHPHTKKQNPKEFFRSDFFIDVGAAGILHKLRRAVDAVLSAVDFGGSVAAADVERMVIAVHARFEAEFQRCEDVWHAYLVPPGAQPVSVHMGEYSSQHLSHAASGCSGSRL